jgi:predicted CXXCH cytochrome family protein
MPRRTPTAAAAVLGAGLVLLSPRWSVAQAATPNNCATCHTQLPDSRLKLPPHAVAGDVHDKAGVHCADCHGGNPAATGAAAAHDPAHGYRGKPSGATICATCHALLADKFKTSVHAQIFDKACVECHGNHGIKPPSDAMLGTSKDALCTTCHSEKDDPGFVAADKMRASIDRLTQGIDAGSGLIARVRNAGIEVGDQELALTEARTKLVLARTEVHAFDPAALDVVVNDGMKIVAGVNQGGNRAVAELAYRRRGLFFFLALTLLFVVALTFKIRDLDRTRQ